MRLSHGLDLHGDGERLSDIRDIYKLSQENFLSHWISSMKEREESVRTPNILVRVAGKRKLPFQCGKKCRVCAIIENICIGLCRWLLAQRS